MKKLPPLDGHSHISPELSPQFHNRVGFIIANTECIRQAYDSMVQHYERIAWGVGCHPRGSKWQADFDRNQFEKLIKDTAIVGEIGLDAKSRVPFDRQLVVFRTILEIVADNPRYTGIHSYCCTGTVLEELKSRPISVPVLHWWTGSTSETKEAVELGCYFTVHTAVARYPKWRLWVPLERILVETDIGYNDPPASIPCRVEYIEHLVAKQYQIGLDKMRKTCWTNLRSILEKTSTKDLVPNGFQRIFDLL